MSKPKPIGITVTENEKQLAIQLFGEFNKTHAPVDGQRFNLFMQIMAERYGYDWQTHEMHPETGEILKK